MAEIREIKIQNCNYVYRIVEIRSDGRQIETGRYRARRRLKVEDRWSMKTATFDSLAEAKSFARLSFAELSALEAADRLPSTTTVFDEAFAKFLHHKEHEQKVSKGTLQGYVNRYHHLEFFKPIAMQAITPKVVDGWIDLILDPRYLATQQHSRINYSHEYTLLAVFLNYYRNFEDETFVVPLLKRHRVRTHGRSKHEDDKIKFGSSRT